MSMLTLWCPGLAAGVRSTVYQPRYHPRPAKVTVAAPISVNKLRMGSELLNERPMPRRTKRLCMGNDLHNGPWGERRRRIYPMEGDLSSRIDRGAAQVSAASLMLRR